ncbi:hypothetical protein BCR37DRAFT_413889 [Protomyces lactucae-debilis]|uniref:Uncharacterized protein n=1 Tax=Protomyces lactucae-debilis TaxID=2754530 RepID=A0A1Y2FCQ0_PROLT|nr:uncharacterized protein BCR37DRAFT_413889 [Protomyces lactucae-debilis]ORY81397.1 hypothetical protein BCR37DRAFT_413889 [Protomyces lactucae-debilis]
MTTMMATATPPASDTESDTKIEIPGCPTGPVEVNDTSRVLQIVKTVEELRATVATLRAKVGQLQSAQKSPETPTHSTTKAPQRTVTATKAPQQTKRAWASTASPAARRPENSVANNEAQPQAPQRPWLPAIQNSSGILG